MPKCCHQENVQVNKESHTVHTNKHSPVHTNNEFKMILNNGIISSTQNVPIVALSVMWNVNNMLIAYIGLGNSDFDHSFANRIFLERIIL